MAQRPTTTTHQLAIGATALVVLFGSVFAAASASANQTSEAALLGTAVAPLASNDLESASSQSGNDAMLVAAVPTGPEFVDEVTKFKRLASDARQAAADLEAAQAAQAAAEAAAHAASHAPRTFAFANVDGLALFLPSANVLAIGYHEARAEHLPLTPLGKAQGNWGLGATPSFTTGPGYVIMPSRDREGTPTSAVDVVMPAGEPVLAPVSGTIVSIGDYVLYDEYDDVQLLLVPDGRPDLAIAIYHVDDIKVHHGQRVTAGRTVLAGTARVFDFIAQVERWGRGPHVDLRVIRR